MFVVSAFYSIKIITRIYNYLSKIFIPINNTVIIIQIALQESDEGGMVKNIALHIIVLIIYVYTLTEIVLQPRSY